MVLRASVLRASLFSVFFISGNVIGYLIQKEKIRNEQTKTMTVREFNRYVDVLEYIVNEKIILLMANVLKAVVTLICLSIKGIVLSLNFAYKITGGDRVDAAKEFAKNVKENSESRSQDDV
ncbi:hypothetical protein [Myxosarcina sp. GI1(2024)]